MESKGMKIPVLLSLYFLATTLVAQEIPNKWEVFLKIQGKNAFKIDRYYVGDYLEYKTNFHKKWQQGHIEKIDLIDQMIYFTNGPVPVDQLKRIQTPKQANIRKWFKYSFLSTGSTLAVFGALSGNWPGAFIGVGMACTGFLLGEILKLNSRKIGKLYTAELVDVRMP